MDWEHCTHQEHTEQYARWLESKDVGGILSQWMSPEEQRVWLKDGPMKEFARAMAGEGPFAFHLQHHPRSPSLIVERTLGPPWKLRHGSTGIKPLQCEASDGRKITKIFWGPAKDFKHLLWAALDAWQLTPDREMLIVVFDTMQNQITLAERNKLEAFGRRCQFKISFIRI